MLTMNKMINIPVARIRAKMMRVSEGDFERDPSIEWDHELGEIGKGIHKRCIVNSQKFLEKTYTKL